MKHFYLLRSSIIILGVIFILPLMGQNKQDDVPINRNTTHAFMLGVGFSNQLDTYLSTQEYTGLEFNFLRETHRRTSILKERVSVQTLFHGDVSLLHSPTNNGKEWSGNVDWTILWHYHFHPLRSLNLLIGTGAQGNIGFLYNLRNGNNPAQAKVYTNLPISGTAIWKFKLMNYPLSLRYQINLPLVGLTFSPNYGQSYYEIFSLGETDNNICLTSIFNAFSIKQLFTLDIPMKGNTLRMGYLGNIYQYKVNNLKYHKWSSSFMLGFVKHFSLVKSLEKQRNNFIY